MSDQRTSPTSPHITFTVDGIPSPQAGTRSVDTAQGVRHISTGGKNLRAWRNAVTAAAIAERVKHDAIDGPISVAVRFRFPMPKSRPTTDKDRVMIPKTTRPDLDKLQRAIGDSLQASGLIGDDSQIVEWWSTKVEVWGEWTGAAISIRGVTT